MISKILFHIKFRIRREQLIRANWKARNERPQTQPAKRTETKPAGFRTWQNSLNELESI
jgi:hypothetical protein